MAQERIMAETGSIPTQASPEPTVDTQQLSQSTRGRYTSSEYDPKREDYEIRKEGHETVFIDPKTGKEVARVPIVAGGAGAEEWLKEAATQKQSIFQEADEVVRLASKFSDDELAQFETDHPGFQTLRTDSIRIINETLNPQAEQEQRERERVLYFVRDDIRRVYLKATEPVPKVRTDYGYPAPAPENLDERLDTVDKALANYQERFWDYGKATLRRIFGENADIPALRQKYEGAASHLASRVAVAIGKEVRRVFGGLPLEPGEELGDLYLANVKRELEATKGERERIRREQRKRATADERLHYNNWREKFDFTWAETPEELQDSVYDWLDYFQQQLPNEAEDKVYESINTGLHNALASLEHARNNIGLAADSVIAQELRETIVGHVTTIGGVRLLESREGFEYYVKLRGDYAKNYIGHNDRIYLKEGSAIMADQLSENDGAIYKGGPEDILKPLAGDTKTFRSELERQAIAYATNHQLYITKDDFEIAELGEREIRQEVARLNLSFNAAQDMIRQILEQRRAAGERGGRYGWYDGIEELLLVDSRGRAKAQLLADPQKRTEALARIEVRTRVFRGIKEALDKEDGLFGKTTEERRAIIRQRIEDKMAAMGNTVLLREIRALPDQAVRDRALWKWVKDYNKPILEFRREGSTDEPWFPSLWDRERLLIDKPEGLVDRALERYELKAMIEEIEDPYKGLTEEQIEQQITNEFRTSVIRAVQARNLPPDEAAREFNRLMQARQEDVKRRVESVLFERKQREVKAIRNYNINRAHDKFLGLEARWGGMVTRKVNKEGKVELVTIFSEARDVLKAKIDAEEREIKDKVNAWKPGFVATHPGLTAEEIEAKTIEQRRLLRRNATFAATLGLREIGIAHDLPIWNYFYYGDPALIGAFAPLIGYTDDDKVKVVEVLEKGRREMEAVFAFLADEHMDGQILVVRGTPGLKIEDEDGNLKDSHEEIWVTPRIINEGGVLKLRDLFESRFMLSKSGGVKVPDLITKIAALGVFDELWEHGCWDKREWQGFMKRRNKWELRRQSFLNIRENADPVSYAKRLGGAGGARRFLVGGEVQGQGYVPGVLNELYNGLWRWRDEFLGYAKWIGTNIGKIISGERKLPRNVNWDKLLRDETILEDSPILSKPEEMTEYRAQVLKVLDRAGMTKYLGPVAFDRMVSVGGEILKFMLDFMNSREYVRNKASFAPKNWQYDNELIARALFIESKRRVPIIAKKGDLLPDRQIAAGGELIAASGGEVLGEDHLAYATEGRTEVGNDIFTAILRASSYHILDAQTARDLEGRAKVIKEKMDSKRKELMDKILPQAAQVAINTERQSLQAEEEAGKRILEEFAQLATKKEGITPEHRVQYGQKLQGISNRRRDLQVKIAKLTNEAVEEKLDRQLNTGDLTHQTLRTMIVGRRVELANLHVDPNLGNIELEINRLINQYIDYQLHREFVGEWPVRLLA